MPVWRETVAVSSRFHLWIAWWPMAAHALECARTAATGATPSRTSWVVTCVGAAAATIECLGKDLSDTLSAGDPPTAPGHTRAWRASTQSANLLGLKLGKRLLDRIDEVGNGRNASLHHTPEWVKLTSGHSHPDAVRFSLDLAEHSVEALTGLLQVIARGPRKPFTDNLLQEQVKGICDAADNASRHLVRHLGQRPQF